jgi:protein-disulfide isomerase
MISLKTSIHYKFVLPVLLFALSFTACGQEGPSLKLQGKRLTEKDVKKEMPDQYASIRRQYDSQISSLLEELATRKILELEAKSQGKSVEEFIKGIAVTVPEPTEAEIQQQYQELKANGVINNRSLAELHPQIAALIRNQRGQELIQGEISKLKKKYDLEMPRNEVAIDNEPVRGNRDAKVVVVEFSDFECPFCQRVQKTTAEVREKYSGKIQWVFKDFPLSFHQNALTAHIAANCVHRESEDTYWKFFDALFSDKRTADTLTGPGLERIASSLGVNMDTFRTCLSDPAVRKEIEEDMKQGESLGVSGTPAFFINGRVISGAQPVSAFTSLIDDEL